MFALGPEPKATTRCRASGAARPLIGGSTADFFDQQSVDSAPRIEPRDPRQTAVEHNPDAVDSEGSFRDVRGHDGPAFFVMRECGILFGRRQLAMKRKNDEAVADAGRADGGNRSANFIFSRHENQNVSGSLRREPFQLVGGQLPDWV